MWIKCFEDAFSNTVNDNYCISKYNVNNVEIQIKYMFVQSKLNYYQLKLSDTEFAAEDMKKTILIMDQSLINLQSIRPNLK